MTVVPTKHALASVRKINEACYDAANGRCDYVYGYFISTSGERLVDAHRITKARKRRGVLEGYLLATGKWAPMLNATVGK
jgi:hypothetical protein